ncbi:MAG: AAA family ATPase, partial [Archaeoglobaceae archaeon]
MLKLKEIHVKNFKSLKDCKIELGNLNVLVGKNGSGKTNFVDLFVLLKKIYDSRELNPFRAWWGYQNVVYGRKEDLDIEVKFLFDYFNYSVEFETIFNGRGGKFEFVSEKLKIDGLV